MNDLAAKLAKLIPEELARNHDGDESALRCACPDCVQDLVEVILATVRQERPAPQLRDAFKNLSEALYWALIPSNLERAMVTDRLHRMHVAVHEVANV